MLLQILFTDQLLALAFIFLSHEVTYIHSANILALFPFPLSSHFRGFDYLLVELAKRNHTLTVVTSFPKSDPHPNYKQIDVRKCFNISAEPSNIDYIVNKWPRDIFRRVSGLTRHVKQYEKVFQCAPIHHLQTSSNSTYDLILIEQFVSDAILAYPYTLQIPFVLLSSHPLMPWSSAHVGNPQNPAYIPLPTSHYPMGPRLSFYDRLYNTVLYVVMQYYYNYKWVPLTDQIVRKYFDSNMPSVRDIAKNASMLMTFHHFYSFTYPQPLVPAVVEVGGLHINDNKSLPQDIKKLLDDAKDGAIYFSMGSLLRPETMAPQIRDMFVEAFRNLSQKILWKWDSDELPNKPVNVMTRKWMPQRDILAHPNVKLFISHGGAKGTYEAIWEAKPILGIPIFGDQMMNVKSIEVAGVGLQLRYKEIISTDIIISTINSIIQNRTYTKNAEKLSKIFKDRPLPPLEEAVYWTEYVIRHNGARHLRSAAVFLPWYQYLLLDVMALILVVILIVLTVFFLLAYYSIRNCRMYMSKSKTNKNKKL